MQSVKSELEVLSIPYMVKNEYASGAMGELPWQESQPELWLLDDSWLTRAKRVIDAVVVNSTETSGSAWQCEGCGEENGAAFDICWKCGRQRPEI